MPFAYKSKETAKDGIRKAPEFVWYAQILALVVVGINEVYIEKCSNLNRSGKRGHGP